MQKFLYLSLLLTAALIAEENDLEKAMKESKQGNILVYKDHEWESVEKLTLEKGCSVFIVEQAAMEKLLADKKD